MNTKILLLSTAVGVVLFSACNTKSTNIVAIRYSEEDTSTHVAFRATIVTGMNSKSIETETPYKLEFTDESFVVITYPREDSVNLFMEAHDKSSRGSRVKGWAHSGTIFYLKPNGGPGYLGGPK